MVLISEQSLPEVFPYLRNSVIEGIYPLYLGSILGSWLKDCVERITFVLVHHAEGPGRVLRRQGVSAAVWAQVCSSTAWSRLSMDRGGPHGRRGLGKGELWCLSWSWWGGSAFSPPWYSVAWCFSELTEVSCFPSSVLCGIADCCFGLSLGPAAGTAPAVLHPSSDFPGRGHPASRGAGIPQAGWCLPFSGWDGCWVMLPEVGTAVHSCWVTCWLVWALPKLPEISTCTGVFQHVLSCGISSLIGKQPSRVLTVQDSSWLSELDTEMCVSDGVLNLC